MIHFYKREDECLRKVVFKLVSFSKNPPEMKNPTLILSLFLPLTLAKFKCPAFTKLTDDLYTFMDAERCDLYWECRSGNAKRIVCPDGLVFHPDKPKGEDPCDLKHNLPDKCKNRPGLQRPKPGDGNCPRQNGVYPSADQFECDVFYSCLNGKGSPTKCAEGLHFSEDIGTCVWARESGREGCASAEERHRKKAKKTEKNAPPKEKPKSLANGFTCPGGALGVHPALPHPDSCRQYYICLDGITPTEYGCAQGKVFNPRSEQCDVPANVDGCEDFYDPKAKKKKADIAESLGADIGDKDFTKFLKLIQMSGLIPGSVEPDIRRPGGGIRPARPNRNRPNRRGGNRRGGSRKGGRKHQRRPVKPVLYDSYEYYDDDEYEYEDYEGEEKEVAAKEEKVEEKETRRRPFSSTKPKTTSTTTKEEDASNAIRDPSPFSTKSSSRSKSAFYQKFRPSVKAVGDLENIHPLGPKPAKSDPIPPPEPAVSKPSKSAAAPPRKAFNLSPADAAAIFANAYRESPGVVGVADTTTPAPSALPTLALQDTTETRSELVRASPVAPQTKQKEAATTEGTTTKPRSSVFRSKFSRLGGLRGRRPSSSVSKPEIFETKDEEEEIMEDIEELPKSAPNRFRPNIRRPVSTFHLLKKSKEEKGKNSGISADENKEEEIAKVAEQREKTRPSFALNRLRGLHRTSLRPAATTTTTSAPPTTTASAPASTSRRSFFPRRPVFSLRPKAATEATETSVAASSEITTPQQQESTTSLEESTTSLEESTTSMDAMENLFHKTRKSSPAPFIPTRIAAQEANTLPTTSSFLVTTARPEQKEMKGPELLAVLPPLARGHSLLAAVPMKHTIPRPQETPSAAVGFARGPEAPEVPTSPVQSAVRAGAAFTAVPAVPQVFLPEPVEIQPAVAEAAIRQPEPTAFRTRLRNPVAGRPRDAVQATRSRLAEVTPAITKTTPAPATAQSSRGRSRARGRGRARGQPTKPTESSSGAEEKAPELVGARGGRFQNTRINANAIPARQENIRQMSTRTESRQEEPEPIRKVPARQEPVRQVAARPEPIRQPIVRTEQFPARLEPSRQAPARPEPVRPVPARNSPLRVARPVQEERIEPAFQQLPAVPARVAPRPASPSRLDPFRVDPARPEPLGNNNVLAQNLHAFPDTFTTFQGTPSPQRGIVSNSPALSSNSRPFPSRNVPFTSFSSSPSSPFSASTSLFSSSPSAFASIPTRHRVIHIKGLINRFDTVMS